MYVWLLMLDFLKGRVMCPFRPEVSVDRLLRGVQMIP